MGIFDFMKNAGDKIFGRDNDKDSDINEPTVPLSSHLRRNGIDPTGIRFKFDGTGTVTMEGTVKDQETREKAVLIVGNVDGIERVDDRLRVAQAGADFSNVASSSSTVKAPAGASGSVAHASAGSQAGDGWSSKTYTVKSGDTMSKIAQEMYGDSSAYNKIFEANQPMVKDADKIYPGQVLRIPAR